MASAVDKLGWKLMGPMTATAAATATRKFAEKAYKVGTGEAPPENPAAPHVPLRQAIIWAILSGVGVALVKMMVERSAAAAWLRKPQTSAGQCAVLILPQRTAPAGGCDAWG